MKWIGFLFGLLVIAACINEAELERKSQYVVTAPLYPGCEDEYALLVSQGIRVERKTFTVEAGILNPIDGFVELYSPTMKSIDVQNAALSALSQCTPNSFIKMNMMEKNSWVLLGGAVAHRKQMGNKIYSISLDDDYAEVYYLDR